MFEHNDLKANPDGVYYKVFGKLSAGDITSAEAAEDLMKGIDDCYNF
jgi:oligogalacturonide transport system substrate-binding protein